MVDLGVHAYGTDKRCRVEAKRTLHRVDQVTPAVIRRLVAPTTFLGKEEMWEPQRLREQPGSNSTDIALQIALSVSSIRNPYTHHDPSTRIVPFG